MSDLTAYKSLGKSLSTFHKSRYQAIGQQNVNEINNQNRQNLFNMIYQGLNVASGLEKNYSDAQDIRKYVDKPVDRNAFQSTLDSLGKIIGIDNFGDIFGVDYKGMTNQDTEYLYLKNRFKMTNLEGSL